jgi:arylsulfatase A-like enzyme/Flp pilus assembly protein TadD
LLLITMDTTRADHLGCYGRTPSPTPNVDRLAREGARFARCTTCSPITLPSHSSIMTGLYPYVHGARQNGSGRLAQANLTLAEALREAGYRTQATVASFVLNQQFGIGQGFEVYHDVVPAVAGNPLNAERKGNEVGDDALQMLETLAGQRFFLWVHFYDPHFPYESTRVRDVESPLAYEDEIRLMDTQIGRLLDKLHQLGREHDTLVVAVADHGEGLGQHDELMHGYFLYQTTLHTPLIFRCPGVIPAGQTVASPVCTIDVAPTILDLLGCPAWDQAQGTSLKPLLAGRQADLNLAGYGESFDAHVEYGLSPLRSLSAGAWKYVLAPKPELYQLTADPDEIHNLLTEQPKLAEKMREQLRQLLADAPPPPAQEDSTVTPHASETEILESLGYVGGASIADDGLSELDRFEPSGGDPKDHARHFQMMVRDLPKLQARNDQAGAERLLRELAEAMPQASRLRVHLAAALNAQGRADEAAAAFEQAVALAPNDYDVRRKYGSFLARAGRYQAAVEQFEIVLEKLPDDTAALEDAARALASLGQFERAEEYLRRAMQVAPKNARLLRAMGMVFERQGKLMEAARFYREALEINPNYPECQRDLERVQRALWP